MSDLISRAELFNRLATCQDKGEIFAVIQGMPTVDMPRWIPVEERLPDAGVPVITASIVNGHEWYCINELTSCDTWRLSSFVTGKITYWMPLPFVPEAPHDHS